MKGPILRLPFGNDRIQTYESEEAFGAALRQARRPIADFSFTTESHRSGVAAVRIGDTIFSAAFSEPMHTKCLVDPQVSFVLPLMGSGKIIAGSQFVEWMSAKLIIGNSYDRPVEFVTAANAILTLRTAPGKLQDALERALRDTSGPDAAGADKIVAKLLVRGPFIDPGRAWLLDYHAAIMRIVQLIDNCNCDEALLARIGLEEVVNRLLAQLVLEQEQAERTVTEALPAATRSVRAVDFICDHIRNNIGSPLSISQMEKLTGLTGRALNYAFRARFDCTPQEWQRNFLLDHARATLKDPDYTGSVKALAYELGFSTPSSFAAFFKQRFGELPSETLAQAPRPRTKG